MIEIVSYKKELLADFVYNGVEKHISSEQITPIVEFYANMGDVYVGIIDGKVIGVGGVFPLWFEAGSAFLFLNKEVVNHKITIFKALLEYMHMLINKHGIKTLMVDCLDNQINASSLIQHLGFVKEREFKMSRYFLKENKK